MFSLSKAQEPLEVDGYRIRVKRHSLWGYVGKITVNPTIEHVKIVAIREATSRELVPQSSSSWEEAVRVELTSHQWNMKGIGVGPYNVCGMAGCSRVG